MKVEYTEAQLDEAIRYFSRGPNPIHHTLLLDLKARRKREAMAPQGDLVSRAEVRRMLDTAWHFSDIELGNAIVGIKHMLGALPSASVAREPSARGECCRCDWRGNMTGLREENGQPLCPKCARVVRSTNEPSAREQLGAWLADPSYPGEREWRRFGQTEFYKEWTIALVQNGLRWEGRGETEDAAILAALEAARKAE